MTADPRVQRMAWHLGVDQVEYAAAPLAEIDALDPLRLALTNPSKELLRRIADSTDDGQGGHILVADVEEVLAALDSLFGILP